MQIFLQILIFCLGVGFLLSGVRAFKVKRTTVSDDCETWDITGIGAYVYGVAYLVLGVGILYGFAA